MSFRLKNQTRGSAALKSLGSVEQNIVLEVLRLFEQTTYVEVFLASLNKV